MKRVIAMVLFFSGVGVFWAQENQKSKGKSLPATAASATTPPCLHLYRITQEDSERPNPVRFTEASVVRGRRVYFFECAMCHGERGDGEGEVALMPTGCRSALPDFTKAGTLNDRTDGDLFAILTKGTDTMPGLEKVLEEKQRWDLINFLRATSGRLPEESPGAQD